MNNAMMKMKRMLGILTLAIVLLTDCNSVIASETNPWLDDSSSGGEYVHSDVLPEEKKAIEILAGLDIIEDAYYYMQVSNEPISRFEAAQILYNFSGMSYIAGEYYDFEDIASSDVLNYVVSTKIMQGTSNNTFSPDASITYDQLCKIVVAFMGYGDYAEHNGGYPGGYLKIATERRLVDAVVSDKGTVTAGEFALVIYKLFDNHKLEIKDYGDNNTYQLEENNVLYQNLGIIMDRDVVNGIGNRATGKVFADHQNRVHIGYNEYILPNYSQQQLYDLSLLVGRKIEYYYSSDKGSDPKLDFYYVDDKLSNVITIKSSSVNSISNGTIVTDDRKYSVESSAIVMKNYQSIGKTFGMCLQNEILPKTGHINLIDNDNNGTVDYCHVISYINVIVDTVSTRNETITNKYRSDKFVLDTEYWIPSIAKNGTVMKMTDIKEWSAIGVMLNGSGKVVGVDISPYNDIEGCAEALEDNKCYINGDEYVISNDYVVLNKPSMAPSGIKLGIETTFIINPEGEIIAIQQGFTTNSSRYAYIVDADSDLRSVTLKVFTEEGTMKSYALEKKVKIDSNTYTTKDEICGAIAPGGTLKQGLAIIKINSENKIREILYPCDVATNPGLNYDGKFTFDAYYARRTWISGQSKFEYNGKDADPSEREFWATSDTIVFGVPSNYDGSEDDDKFSITDMSVFSDGAAYMVSGYNLDDEYNVGIIVAKLSNTAYINYSETPLGIISGEFYGLNVDGEYVKGIKIFVGGSEHKYLISQDAELIMYSPYTTPQIITADNLKRGDTVRVAVEKNGEIGSLVKHLPDTKDGSILTPSTTRSYNRGAINETTYGKVLKRNANTLVVEVADGEKQVKLPFKVNSSVNIYVYDFENDEIYRGDVSDIPTQGDGAYAIVIANNNAVSDVVVYLY